MNHEIDYKIIGHEMQVIQAMPSQGEESTLGGSLGNLLSGK